MGVVSIDIAAMRELVSSLDLAISRISEDVTDLSRNLDWVDIRVDGLWRWQHGGPNAAQLQELAAECRWRLEKALQICGDDPGVVEVTFNDDVFDTQDAQTAADLLKRWATEGGIIPEELLTLLLAHAGDTDFDLDLAKALPPDVLAGYLAELEDVRARMFKDAGGGDYDQNSSVPGFDDSFAQLLDLLGDSLSSAAQSMPAEDLAAYAVSWQNVVFKHVPGDAKASSLSLVLGRGSWPDSLLDAFTDAVFARDNGNASAWGLTGLGQVFDPAVNESTGAHDSYSDPLTGVFRSAATSAPNWFANRFGSGPLTSVRFDADGQIDQSGEMSQAVHDLILNRGMLDGAADWFQQAAFSATMYATPSEASERLLPDISKAYGSMMLAKREWDEKPWYDKYGHLALELAAIGALFIPAVGPAVSVAITAGDAAFYVEQGDWAGALTSAAFIFIPIGIQAVRWARVSLTAEQVAALKSGRSIQLQEPTSGVTVKLTMKKVGHRWEVTVDKPIPDGIPIKSGSMVQAGDGTLCPVETANPAGREILKKLRVHFEAHSGKELEGKRNFGALEGDINGNPWKTKAVSGKPKKIPDDFVVPAEKMADQHFKSHPTIEDKIDNPKVSESKRAFDTEITLLEDLYRHTSPTDVGEFTLYTERYPCESCQDVVAQFIKERPNIKIKIVYGERYYG
jgi:hypothetical protein